MTVVGGESCQAVGFSAQFGQLSLPKKNKTGHCACWLAGCEGEGRSKIEKGLVKYYFGY